MTLLLLAGTGEARRLAAALAEAGVPAQASLAGGTRHPAPLALPTRSGGFGAADGFRRYLAEAGITAVLDATHPFADRISHRTAAICSALRTPYTLVLRPPWQATSKDRWHYADTVDEAVAQIPDGATVFLATGPQGAAAFAGLKGRVHCRRIDPPAAPFPFDNGAWCVGRPPFSVAEEIALFQRLGIDWLVTKNAGGDGARAKLDAARDLGIPVMILARPAPPKARIVETVEEAMAWVMTLKLAGS